MNEIIFIAKYPTGWLKQDGASIRFLAIDEIFSDFNRTYIESFNFPFVNYLYYWYRDIKRGYNKLPESSDNKIKSYKYLTKNQTIKIFENAKIIYIENFTNLAKLDLNLIKKYGYKMVLDFHGCVIEEMEMMNAPIWKISNMKKYEKFALKYIKTFVSVTNNMTTYYQNKYQESKKLKYITLPIFNSSNINFSEKKENALNILYSGRNQVWQNPELMVKSIAEVVKNKKISNINYTFLTPDIQYYTNLAKKYEVENYITIKSVAPNDLNQEYAKAHLGFILRDDNVVNRVACPTKLVEYMKAGIIPIVLQPEIGDFNKLGYKYILNSDIRQGNLPSIKELKEMQKINLEIINELEKNVASSKAELQNLL